MNRSIFIMLIVSIPLMSALKGQSIKINGYVKDTSRNSIPFASIAVFNDNKQELIGGAISDSSGFFHIDVANCSDIKLIVSFVAHKSDTLSWFMLRNDTTLNIEILLRSSTSLIEMTISAQKPLIEHKVDRIVFNVPRVYKSAGNTAWDIIKKTPGLTTNPDGVITAGSKGLTLMINNRPVQLPPEQVASLLQNLSASDITSIEIIHTPPPQFDAQNGGLINIVLTKTKEKSWSSTFRSDYVQATYPKLINGLSLQFNHNKFNITAQYMNRFRIDYISEDGTIDFNESNWKLRQNRIVSTSLHQYRIGLDYQLFKNHTLGFLIDGYRRVNETTSHMNTNTFNILTNQIDSFLLTNASGNSRQNFHSINLHYLNIKNKNLGVIAFDIDYIPATDERNRKVESNSYVRNDPIPLSSFNNNQYTQQTNDLLSIKSEVNTSIRIMDTIFQTYYGIKWNKSNIDNFQTFFEDSTSSLYSESIFSAFVGTSSQFKSLHFQIGARGEYTIITNKFNLTELPVNKYFNLFPAVYLTYPLTENNMIGINFGKRLSRPDFWRLNPFRLYQNPYVFTEGNPTLNPSYVNSLELKYVYRNNHMLSLLLNRTTGNISTLTFQDNSNNTIKNTYINLEETLEAGVNLSSTFFLNNFWQSNNYFQVLYKNDQIIFNSTPSRFNIWYGYFSTNNSFYISKDRSWVFDFNCWYGSPSIEAYQYLHENWEVSLGISKQLCRGRLNVRIDAFDIFYTNVNRTNIDFSGQRSSALRKTDTRSFAFRVTYKFGNNLLRERKPRRTSIEDEKKRTIEQ